jgi:hypothetical protein
MKCYESCHWQFSEALRTHLKMHLCLWWQYRHGQIELGNSESVTRLLGRKYPAGIWTREDRTPTPAPFLRKIALPLSTEDDDPRNLWINSQELRKLRATNQPWPKAKNSGWLTWRLGLDSGRVPDLCENASNQVWITSIRSALVGKAFPSSSMKRVEELLVGLPVHSWNLESELPWSAELERILLQLVLSILLTY